MFSPLLCGCKTTWQGLQSRPLPQYVRPCAVHALIEVVSTSECHDLWSLCTTSSRIYQGRTKARHVLHNGNRRKPFSLSPLTHRVWLYFCLNSPCCWQPWAFSEWDICADIRKASPLIIHHPHHHISPIRASYYEAICWPCYPCQVAIPTSPLPWHRLLGAEGAWV